MFAMDQLQSSKPIQGLKITGTKNPL